MAIKYTILGALIYVTMLMYLAAFVAFMVAKRKNLGWALYIAGFGAAATAFGVRWYQVGHVPLQSLFEVFLCLGMLICPISLLCRYVLRVGGLAADCLIGAVVLFPAGFVENFSAEPQNLPPALQSPLFAPHVAAYMLAYMIMAKAVVQALGQLCLGRPKDDRLASYELGTYRMVRLGFPVLTLGLILGAWWGKIAWGDYWNWDPKELWSFVSWLTYVGYLHFRYVYGRRFPAANSAMVLLGLLWIIVTLLLVNLSAIFESVHSYSG